jgi:hypothetical protein
MTNQNQDKDNLVLFQNISFHEILLVFMVQIHNDFMLNSFKPMMPFFKGIHDGYKKIYHEYHN